MLIRLLQTQKFFDTSALLGGYKLKADDYNIISPIVFSELENIKISSTKDDSVKYKARSLVRYLMDNPTLWHCELVDQ